MQQIISLTQIYKIRRATRSLPKLKELSNSKRNLGNQADQIKFGGLHNRALRIYYSTGQQRFDKSLKSNSGLGRSSDILARRNCINLRHKKLEKVSRYTRIMPQADSHRNI